MRFVARLLQKQVRQAATSFPAVVLTGPRRAGKTELLRRLFPRASYVLLEDPDVRPVREPIRAAYWRNCALPHFWMRSRTRLSCLLT